MTEIKKHSSEKVVRAQVGDTINAQQESLLSEAVSLGMKKVSLVFKLLAFF